MENNRRRFLASVAAATASALAGCAGDDDEGDRTPFGVDDPVAAVVDAEDEDEAPGGITAPATSYLDDAHAIDLEVGDLTYALAPARFWSTDRPQSSDRVEVRLAFGRTATDGRPATLRARITNGANRERTVDLEETPPFVPDVETGPDLGPTPTRGSDDAGGEPGAVDVAPDPSGELVLAPTDETDLVDLPDGPPACERGPGGYWRLEADAEWSLPRTVELDARESVELTFALVAPPGSEGRPPGTYAVGGGDRIAIVAWPTSEPGTNPDSRFAPGDLPRLPGAGRETAWYHEVDPATPIYVESATERASAPAEYAFDFVNRSHGRVPTSGWRLYKLEGDAWHPVTPTRSTDAARTPLEPGRVRRWRLRAFGAEAGGGSGDGTDAIDVPYLGGGRYAFAVRTVDGTVAAAAFDLEAPALDLEPADDLGRAYDSDATRLVSPERDEGDEPWELALAATDDDTDAEDLLVESVYRHRGLRNVLATAVDEGADRVVLETSRPVAIDAVGRAFFGGPRRFRFRGTTYELEARSPYELEARSLE